MIEETLAPRHRDAVATRQAILYAARTAFTHCGYGSVGVREIAAGAGVTAALINRYFGTKDQLLTEIMVSSEMGFDALLEQDRDNFGRSVARRLIESCNGREDFNPTLILLRSLGDADAAGIFVAQIARWLEPLAAQLGGPSARLRAEMIIATIAGFSILHQIAQTPAIAAAAPDQLIGMLGATLQSFVDAKA